MEKDELKIKKRITKAKIIMAIIYIIIFIVSGIMLDYFENYEYTYEEYTGEYQEYKITYDDAVETTPDIYNDIYKKKKLHTIEDYDTYIKYIETMEREINYSDYITIYPSIYNCNTKEETDAIERLEESFFEEQSLILCFAEGLIDVQENDGTITLQLYEDGYEFITFGSTGTAMEFWDEFNVYFIPISKSITQVKAHYDREPTFTTEKNFCKAIMVVSAIMLIIIIGMKIIPICVNKIKQNSEKNYKKATNGDLKNKEKLCLIIIIIICIIGIFAIAIKVYNNARETIAKPIIYLYPEEETEVSVKLDYPESITVSYPKYETGWNVLAKTDGTLIDLNTNRQLYSLYYESNANIKFEVTNEGFIVKGEDVSDFLEEKLEILGLNERESEEFIIYWLPHLQENEYNYIRFATTEEIEENMPLAINPNPDTVIRVLMTYKGLEKQIKVEEQELETPERTGFVAVEWGGTEIE